MTTVAILGASGFVGATLVERLLAAGRYEVRPWIYTSGRAWRLARYGLVLRSVDLLSPKDVRAAVEGCTHVVNCSRGPERVMLKGLRNLLHACREAGVQRFVHLSSVAVYGEPPSPESTHEDARPQPVRGTYGWLKLRQDDLVQAACRRGLPSVILCPPNVSGAYSPYLLSLIHVMREGQLALVNGGENACNLVDVQNLAQAIELALFCEQADGTRLFITDSEETTWRHVAEALAPLADRRLPLPSVTTEEAQRLLASAQEKRFSVLRSLKHLASQDVRHALCRDPGFARIEQSIRARVDSLPKAFEDRLRFWFCKPTGIRKVADAPTYDKRFLLHQLRGVRHAYDRAKTVLGYAPEVSFAASMQAVQLWYAVTQGWGSDAWSLVQEL